MLPRAIGQWLFLEKPDEEVTDQTLAHPRRRRWHPRLSGVVYRLRQVLGIKNNCFKKHLETRLRWAVQLDGYSFPPASCMRLLGEY